MAVKNKKLEKKKTEVKKTAREKKASPKLIRVKLVRSLIGHSRYQREVIKGLGLRKVNSEVVRRDCPEIRGMINKVQHLVKVEAVEKK